MADCIRLYTSLFTIRNQEIKTLEKLDQAIKQASRDKSSDQASISTIKIVDRHCSWKYRAHSSDYPLANENIKYVLDCTVLGYAANYTQREKPLTHKKP